MVLFNESTGPAIPDSFWVEECVLENNVSEDMGGGLGLFTTNPGMSAVIRNCRLIDNSAASGAAVAIDPVMAEFPGVADAASIRFEGCLMTGNTAPNATLTVRQTGIVELFNCTLADNMAGGLTIDAGGVATMQNTILSNPGYTEYQSLAGNATLASNGGNLIHDGSLGSSNPADMENQSPYFIEGPDCEFYQLSTESPGFDGGVEWDDVPAFDVCGNARIHGNQIDVGAVETPIVATQEAKTGRLAIAPNPANHLVNVEWAAEWDGSLEVYLFSAAGRQLMHHILMKGQSIPLNSIPAGMYTLRMIDETGRVYAGKFVKQ